MQRGGPWEKWWGGGGGGVAKREQKGKNSGKEECKGKIPFKFRNKNRNGRTPHVSNGPPLIQDMLIFHYYYKTVNIIFSSD